MSGYLSAVVARLRRRHADPEAGFGMIELMVAVGVILVAMLAVAYTATVGFTDIAFARQRQAATGIANKTMEQIRALPFDTMANGLSNADLASTTDANITHTGVGSSLVYWFEGEEIARGDLSNVAPLVPHTTSATVGPTTYTIRTYVTYYKDRTTSIYRVTVLASWAGAERVNLSHQIEVQSLFYSPSSGCLSQHTHPFAAPCQAFLYATASADPGHIDVTGTLNGVSFDNASLSLPGYDSGLQAEQIAAVQGDAQTAGATLTLTGQATQTAGMQAISSGADNDPAQIKLNYLSTTSGSQSSQTLTTGGGGSNNISVTSSDSDTARTTSTTSASTLNSNTCPRVTGVTNLSTSAPCGGSTATQGTPLTMQLSLAPNGLEPASLAVAAAPACGSSTCVNNALTHEYLAVPTNGQCPGVAGDGCTHAGASRNLGVMTFGALPVGVIPTGGNGAKWAGYLVQLSGYSDTVSAEAGIGSKDPAVAAPVSGTGSISFWNGNGYTTCTLYANNCGAGGTLLPVTSVAASNGGNISINMTASLTTGGITTDNGGCSGTCTRAQASARSASPLIGDITYTVTNGGSTIADLTIHVDLGTLLATTSYQKAPTGG